MSSGADFLASRRTTTVGAPIIETGLRASTMPWDARGEPKNPAMTMGKNDEKVKTAREPASAHLLIDSLDRYKRGYPFASATETDPQTTSSSWTLQLPQYVLNGFFTRLAVTQVQFQWNLPTVIGGYNDQLVIQSGATVSVAQIPQGFYTPTALASAITAAIAAAPTPPASAITCAFVPLGGYFTLSCAAVMNLVLSQRSARFGITSGLAFGGVIGNGTTDIIGAIPTMLPTRFVDIRSSYLTKNQRVKDVTTLPANVISDIIARIYAMPSNTTTATINSIVPGEAFAYPWVMNQSYPVPKYIRWNSAEPISNFNIELLDDSGLLLPWSANRGCEYALTMIASED